MSVYNLDCLDNDELVAAGVSEKLYCRRAGEDSRRLNHLWDECQRRDSTGGLWQRVLDGVLAEEARLRASNDAATAELKGK